MGSKTENTSTYGVIYASAGLCNGEPGHVILEPIASSSLAAFNQGRTVPAKFRVCDAKGNSIGAPGVVSSFRLVQVISESGVQNLNAEVPSTTPEKDFRWDPQERQWIFNISTRAYLSGRTYFFRIELNDGTDIRFGFKLKGEDEDDR